MFFWRSFAVASSLCSVLLAVFLTFHSLPEGHQASLNQPTAVRVQLEDLQNAKFHSVRVALPSGIEFYSERFPNLRDRKVLNLAWDQSDGQEDINFVIMGTETGKRDIELFFLDDKQQVVATKEVRIAFR